MCGRQRLVLSTRYAVNLRSKVYEQLSVIRAVLSPTAAGRLLGSQNVSDPEWRGAHVCGEQTATECPKSPTCLLHGCQNRHFRHALKNAHVGLSGPLILGFVIFFGWWSLGFGVLGRIRLWPSGQLGWFPVKSLPPKPPIQSTNWRQLRGVGVRTVVTCFMAHLP